MTYIDRHMEEVFLSFSKVWPALLLTGTRRAGKTTMLRKLAQKENIGRTYVSLDDTQIRQEAREGAGSFLRRFPPPVIIDEIQYAPELFVHLKIHVDEHKIPGEFWLTGSQAFPLMKGIHELAGRIGLYSLSTLSQREILGLEAHAFSPRRESLLTDQRNFKPIPSSELFTRIWKGSFPFLVSGGYDVLDKAYNTISSSLGLSRESKDVEDFYRSYVGSYLIGDIRELVGDPDIEKFKRFIKSLAIRCSQIVNYHSIAKDAGITEKMVRTWLDVLEHLGVIFFLHPYSSNLLKRTLKKPKVYFYDTGIVCHLCMCVSPRVAEFGPLSGAILENFAISEVMKSWLHAGLNPFNHFTYYRDIDGKEIDLILDIDGTLYPIEIKQNKHPDTKKIVRTFNSLKKASLPIGSGAILCTADYISLVDESNCIVPISMI